MIGVFLTFVSFPPISGGFNNIRMAMETAVAMAFATGRILVLPPKQQMYLLNKSHNKNHFSFHDFFPFHALAREHPGVEIISMKEFLTREAITSQVMDHDGRVRYPPHNRTLWDLKIQKLFPYIRTVATVPIWDPSQCVVGILSTAGPGSGASVRSHAPPKNHRFRPEKYHNRPTPVDAPPADRLKELLGRRKLCAYDARYQRAKVLHFMGDGESGARLFTHFYTYLFLEDRNADLLVKRFVRDHLRYNDAIQCAVARVVQAMRAKAKEHGNERGELHAFHIRRGDFQYEETRISAKEIYEIKDVLPDNSTVFIATDERKKSFFDDLKRHYHVYFLDDFVHLVREHVDANMYGMLDQRNASRGKIFVGAFLSTFT